MIKKITKREDVVFPVSVVEESLPELCIIDCEGNFLSDNLIIELINIIGELQIFGVL